MTLIKLLKIENIYGTGHISSFKELRNDFSDFCEGINMGAYYNDSGPGVTYPHILFQYVYVSFFNGIFNRLNQLLGRVLCHYFGHGTHFHDNSYGGPESGCMAGYCDRCGWGYHVTLY